MTMRRRMLMAQVIERERSRGGRGCSIYLYLPICEFSLFLKHDFPNWKFSLLWYVEDSRSPLFYFCIPVQFQPSIWISSVASLPPPSAHSEILTVNWPGTPTLSCPTSYSRRKKATMMKMISILRGKRDSWLFSGPRLTIHYIQWWW